MTNPIGPITLLLGALALFGPIGCGSQDADDEEAATPEVTVQVAPVIRTNLRALVQTYGVIEPEPPGDHHPGGEALLAAPDPGVVLEVLVREGQSVHAGDLVVRLDDRIAQAEVDKARHALAFAEEQLAREEKLRASEGTSEKAYQATVQQRDAARAELTAAEGRLARVQLRSPLDGVVTRLAVRPGQAVDANTVVATILDPRRLVATAQVPLAEARAVRPGQPVEFHPDSDAEPVAGGAVTFVAPEADRPAGTVRVRASVPPGADFRAGQWVRLAIVTQVHTNCLAVPREAVYTDPEGHSTIAVVENNVARRKEVSLGLTEGNWVEITGEDLSEGATIVTTGSYALPDGARIHVTETKTTE